MSNLRVDARVTAGAPRTARERSVAVHRGARVLLGCRPGIAPSPRPGDAGVRAGQEDPRWHRHGAGDRRGAREPGLPSQADRSPRRYDACAGAGPDARSRRHLPGAQRAPRGGLQARDTPGRRAALRGLPRQPPHAADQTPRAPVPLPSAGVAGAATDDEAGGRARHARLGQAVRAGAALAAGPRRGAAANGAAGTAHVRRHAGALRPGAVGERSGAAMRSRRWPARRLAAGAVERPGAAAHDRRGWSPTTTGWSIGRPRGGVGGRGAAWAAAGRIGRPRGGLGGHGADWAATRADWAATRADWAATRAAPTVCPNSRGCR